VIKSRKVSRLVTVDFDLVKPYWLGWDLMKCETWSYNNSNNNNNNNNNDSANYNIHEEDVK
jgi:hypothetical protein